MQNSYWIFCCQIWCSQKVTILKLMKNSQIVHTVPFLFYQQNMLSSENRTFIDSHHCFMSRILMPLGTIQKWILLSLYEKAKFEIFNLSFGFFYAGLTSSPSPSSCLSYKIQKKQAFKWALFKLFQPKLFQTYGHFCKYFKCSKFNPWNFEN